MDSDDEQLLRGRIYGADHDHPGPKPGRSYAELVGGPLDGLLLDTTGWRPEEIDDGVSLAMAPAAGRCTTRAPATRPAGTGVATAPDSQPLGRVKTPPRRNPPWPTGRSAVHGPDQGCELTHTTLRWASHR